ncbi:alpha/beta fold hydrolase [Nocardioides sp. URHA0032]|uniref:alpha/beta fold hydrolase n=1 Tax=Nocardioides sp. URHA0032 TaxID=1380388 RepID=UPI00049181F6|nr:alpha/beta fold hydrolase [Nocardioides sp. URHA0032]
MTSPLVLVPGWWLGAWAWDGVAEGLRADGHDVTALTLPGLEPDHPDRGSVSLAGQADAIVAAIEAHDRPVVLAVHSGASQPGYVASDRVPDRIAALIYVDTAPGTGPIKEIDEPEFPLPATWEELGESLDGIPEERLAEFRERAVPEPAGPMRDAPEVTNDARLDVPSLVIATAFPASGYQQAAAEGAPWLAGLDDLRNVAYVDLPTSHWPMWSRPAELTEILDRVARDGITGF